MEAYTIRVDKHGTQRRYNAEGQLHCDTGPAVIWSGGGVEWCKLNLHRTDGPAVERLNGDRYWYDQGQLHRAAGPAVEYASGSQMWYLHGQLHRESGPAVENAVGTRWWYLHGQRHRVDGPAVEYPDGSCEWYLNDVRMSEKEFLTRTRRKQLTVAEIEKLLGYKIQIVS